MKELASFFMLHIILRLFIIHKLTDIQPVFNNGEAGHGVLSS
jgi:hypothetical protein